MKGKEELHSFCQNTEQDRGESYYKRYYRKGSLLKYLNEYDRVSLRVGPWADGLSHM
jgi:hypothetical protein